MSSLDLDRLSFPQRVVIECLYYGEHHETPRRYMPCGDSTINMLLRTGWIEHRPERLESRRYDDVVYHEAMYWLSDQAWQILQSLGW